MRLRTAKMALVLPLVAGCSQGDAALDSAVVVAVAGSPAWVVHPEAAQGRALHRWTLLEAPSGGEVVNEQLVDRADPAVSVTPPVEGEYLFEVERCVVSCATTVLQMLVGAPELPTAQAPIADAGGLQLTQVGRQVRFSAQEALPVGDVQYSWSLLYVPDGALVSDELFIGRETPSAWFSPDVEGAWFVLNTAKRGIFVSHDVGLVWAFPGNAAPIPDVRLSADTVPVGVPVFVDVSGSYDREGDDLLARYEVAEAPEGSAVDDELLRVNAVDGMYTHFVVDLEGIYRIKVYLTDPYRDWEWEHPTEQIIVHWP
ncbi:MAG: hypothetical protein H6740_25705 [Alphaproteobacteria bacterium]|nr:hypothetical protein [Alphaproteobacteria bacterium]